MSTFLEGLERELHAAHGRRHSARRRAAAGRALRSLPALAAAVLLVAGAVVFVAAVGREDGQVQRGASRPEGPALAPGPAALDDKRVAVLNATTQPGLGLAMATFLGIRSPEGVVGDSWRHNAGRTTVRYAPGAEVTATRLASSLGVEARPIDADLRRAAGDAELVVEVGRDVRGSHAVELRDEVRGGSAGTVSVLDRNGLPDVVWLRGPRPTGPADGVWLIGGRLGGPTRFLGFVEADQPRLDVVFTAPDTYGRRLVVSAERSTPPVGSKPRRVILSASL